MCLLLLHFLPEHFGSDYDVMSCDRCSYYGTFLTGGRLPWLCDIYVGLTLRDAFGSFCALAFEV